MPMRFSATSSRTCSGSRKRGFWFRASAEFEKRLSAILTRGKGKRGGFRYLYVYFISDQQMALLYLLDKNEQDDLTQAQREILRALASQS
jgi:hypothetical protein